MAVSRLMLGAITDKTSLTCWVSARTWLPGIDNPDRRAAMLTTNMTLTDSNQQRMQGLLVLKMKKAESPRWISLNQRRCSVNELWHEQLLELRHEINGGLWWMTMRPSASTLRMTTWCFPRCRPRRCTHRRRHLRSHLWTQRQCEWRKRDQTSSTCCCAISRTSTLCLIPRSCSRDSRRTPTASTYASFCSMA